MDLAGVNLDQSMTETFGRRLGAWMTKAAPSSRNFCAPPRGRWCGAPSPFPILKQATITDALKPFVGERAKIAFETKPELIAGIELIANGHKIAWSISDYLGDLSDALGALVESKSSPAPAPPKIVPHAA